MSFKFKVGEFATTAAVERIPNAALRNQPIVQIIERHTIEHEAGTQFFYITRVCFWDFRDENVHFLTDLIKFNEIELVEFKDVPKT